MVAGAESLRNPLLTGRDQGEEWIQAPSLSEKLGGLVGGLPRATLGKVEKQESGTERMLGLLKVTGPEVGVRRRAPRTE